MIPGKTYVGILPGHTRPAFVRKRPVDAGRPPLLLTQIFGCTRRAYSVEASRKPSMFCRSRSDVYYDYATARYRPKKYVDQSPGRTITSIQQTCASCGKFRSARWQSQHPFIPGTTCTPGLCGKCRDKHTSSEEERPRHRRRRHRHRLCDYTESTDDSYNTSRESRRATRRLHSCRRDCRGRSLARSSSREKVRIIIANQAGDRIRPEREKTRSSSMEPVRVTRCTEIVDLPEKPLRTRSILRSSSHAAYVDNATKYIEDLDPTQYLPRRRFVDRLSHIEDAERPRYRRPGSLSHVSYVEELGRPRHRSRSRSVSRVSYTEDLGSPRSRRRARSSSQVRFDDEAHEPVSLSKPRSLKRRRVRRVVYYDGPADTENSEQQAYSVAAPNHRSSQGAASGEGSAVLIEKTLTPHSGASRKAIGQERGVELIEERFIPHRRASSQSSKGFESRSKADHYRQPSETWSYAHESDHNATSRTDCHRAQIMQSPEGVEKSLSHDRSYIDFKGVRHYTRYCSPASEPRELSRQRVFTGPEKPCRERRERVRESDESSSSADDDDYPRSSPNNSRHVEAPEPPALSSDLLVEMLQNASITPPYAQRTRGRPSHQDHYDDLDFPSQHRSHRTYSSEHCNDGHTGYGGRRVTGESPSLHKPAFKSNAKYDWMT